MSPASGDAEIRDVRYSRYDGERRGAMSGVISLARWGALRSLGARRGWKAKAVPITLALLAVAPAIIKTDFAKALYEGREAEVAAGFPLARLGEAADVAGPVAFLLSDDAAWITGRTIVIDGGGSLRPIG